MATLCREADGPANVLRGTVSLANKGGFIQMATDLDRNGNLVDASRFDGVELMVRNANKEHDGFHVQYVCIYMMMPATTRLVCMQFVAC